MIWSSIDFIQQEKPREEAPTAAGGTPKVGTAPQKEPPKESKDEKKSRFDRLKGAGGKIKGIPILMGCKCTYYDSADPETHSKHRWMNWFKNVDKCTENHATKIAIPIPLLVSSMLIIAILPLTLFNKYYQPAIDVLEKNVGIPGWIIWLLIIVGFGFFVPYLFIISKDPVPAIIILIFIAAITDYIIPIIILPQVERGFGALFGTAYGFSLTGSCTFQEYLEAFAKGKINECAAPTDEKKPEVTIEGEKDLLEFKLEPEKGGVLDPVKIGEPYSFKLLLVNCPKCKDNTPLNVIVKPGKLRDKPQDKPLSEEIIEQLIAKKVIKEKSDALKIPESGSYIKGIVKVTKKDGSEEKISVYIALKPDDCLPTIGCPIPSKLDEDVTFNTDGKINFDENSDVTMHVETSYTVNDAEGKGIFYIYGNADARRDNPPKDVHTTDKGPLKIGIYFSQSLYTIGKNYFIKKGLDCTEYGEYKEINGYCQNSNLNAFVVKVEMQNTEGAKITYKKITIIPPENQLGREEICPYLEKDKKDIERCPKDEEVNAYRCASNNAQIVSKDGSRSSTFKPNEEAVLELVSSNAVVSFACAYRVNDFAINQLDISFVPYIFKVKVDYIYEKTFSPSQKLKAVKPTASETLPQLE